MKHNQLPPADVGAGAPPRLKRKRALVAFAAAFKPQRKLLVGGDGIGLEEFLMRDVAHWVGP